MRSRITFLFSIILPVFCSEELKEYSASELQKNPKLVFSQNFSKEQIEDFVFRHDVFIKVTNDKEKIKQESIKTEKDKVELHKLTRSYPEAFKDNIVGMKYSFLDNYIEDQVGGLLMLCEGLVLIGQSISYPFSIFLE